MNHPIVQWNPFHELEQMHERLTSFFEDDRSRRNGRELPQPEAWAPTVDIIENDSAYLVTAELPGVRKEDIHITLEEGVLTIAGERKQEQTEKARKFHRVERSYGSFTRSFRLPDNIDAEKIEARFRDGVLAVAVAKSETARPRHIEVRVN
jgi:HSP20 family protein